MSVKFRCNCNATFGSKAAMVKHYRREHPDDGARCWEQIGDLGDEFANGAMEYQRDVTARLRKDLSEAQDRVKTFDEVVSAHNSMVSVLTIIQSAFTMLPKPKK